MLFLSRVGVFLFFSLLAFSALSADIPEVEKIDINTAPLEDLVKIIHIGEVRARELIFLRPFSSLDDLTRIKGIDETKLEDIKEQGLAWVSEETVGAKDRPKEYPSGIVINEILPSPEGLDAENEWIEIFNQNNFAIDLSGWQLTDLVGTTKTYTFSKGSVIEANGFLLLSRPTTKITLNNSGDGLNLIQPNGKIIDEVNYKKTPRGQSYNRTLSGWVWSTTLTPKLENIITVQKTEESEFVEETGKIDINIASAKELQKITGIGPVSAQKIMEARPFYSLDELTRVSGIGPKTLEKIKSQGLAWVNPELKPPKIEKTEPLKRGLAAAAEPVRQGSLGRKIPKSLSLFFTALALAIFSGIIILILKKNLKHPHPNQ